MAVLRQRVIPVRSRYVNSFIVQGQAAILVDTGMPGFEERILQKMQEKGVRWSDVSLILITHGHHDHFGSAAVLREKTGAPLAVHKADAETLRSGINPKLNPIGAKGTIMAGLSRAIKIPKVKGIDADILIDGEMDLASFGVAGRVVPTPGHTQGSLSIFMDGGCVLVGDLIFGGMFRRKAPDFPLFGYDTREILASIKKVLELNPKIVYAGHGGPFTVDSVRRRFFG
jgi:hydroxyacylglutathione hydrolase